MLGKKFKNLKCDKLKFGQNSRTQVIKERKKTQIMTKLKNSNCD